MKKCKIYHTGVLVWRNGFIKDNRVFLEGEDGALYFPEEMGMAKEECESGLIQIEVDGKWGFAYIFTGEIKIEPIWDYAGPFYGGFAHVAVGNQLSENKFEEPWWSPEVRGGKHGYINTKGEIIIPLNYDQAEEIPRGDTFKVSKNGYWGLVNQQNSILIPFLWWNFENNNKITLCCRKEICGEYTDEEWNSGIGTYHKEFEKPHYKYLLKWVVYDQNFRFMVGEDVDDIITPRLKKEYGYRVYNKFIILKRKRKYGIICNDGRWIANIELTKKQANVMLNNISREYSGKIYLPK